MWLRGPLTRKKAAGRSYPIDQDNAAIHVFPW
jgi:hypothetical protein